MLGAKSAWAGNLEGTVTFIPIATNAYGTDDVNSCGVTRNDLVTIGNYQYTAYYKYNSKSDGAIVVGRRATNSSTWTLVTTNYKLQNSSDSLYSGAIDDHDVVALAVDGNGDMQLSWGMHNNALNYAISSSSVNGATFDPQFVTQTSTNNPTLFSQLTSSGIDQVTYPEFYYIPSSNGTPSGNLLFDYRDAASSSGGGSGNGNTYFATYNYSSSGFTSPSEVLDGGITSVNGYQNRLVYDSNGNLLMTWTWRSTPNFQTNNNILFAQSPNNGQTWYQQGGTTQYTLPIIANTSNGGSASQVAQVVQTISQNSSLINQSSMTVDKNNNPVIATWLTSDGNASLPVSATNSPNLQYELIYYTGSTWEMSQITHRTSDTAFDTSGDFVRDVARPIVLVDNSDRVLVIGRSEDTGMGSYSNPSTPNNNLTVYWNTMASLDSASPAPWRSFALDTANMGEYEPSYDPTAWTSSDMLDLFYEPVGLSGETTGTAQVLQWNEAAFNFSAATPSVMTWDASTTGPGILDGGGIWDTTHTNFSDGYANYAWSANFSNSAVFGASNGAAGTVTLGANITASSLIFDAPGSGSYNIAGGGYTLTLSSSATIVANVNATISAPITTSGTLTKLGAGILTLGGNNTIAGTLQLGDSAVSGGLVNGGVCITSAAALGGLSSVVLSDNNSAYDLFQLNGSGEGISLPASLAFTWDADSAGPGGAGATIFESIAGNNTVAGPITFQVGGEGYGIAVDSGSLTFSANLSTSSHVVYLRGAGSGYFSGNLSGTGSFEVDGPGTWTLGGTDSYSGTTTIAGGALNISSGASITSTAVTVDSGAALNVFGSLAAGTTLVTAGTVNLEPNTASGILTRTLASLNVSSGGAVNVIAAPVHANRTLLVTAAPILAGATDAWQGLIDLANNDMVAQNGSLSAITNQVAQAYAGGAWNGAGGITSSVAATDSMHLTTLGVVQNTVSGGISGELLYGTGSELGSFDGFNPQAADVLVKYTWYGDTDLDGVVDATDYSRIDAGYLDGATGWYNGDFNYDGVINGSDYTLIDNAFNAQGPSLTSSDELASIASQFPQSLPVESPVPEPPAFGLLAFLILPQLSQRLRHRKV